MSESVSVEGAFLDLAIVRILVPHTVMHLFDRAVAALIDVITEAAESHAEVAVLTQVAREAIGCLADYEPDSPLVARLRDDFAAALTPKEETP